MPLQPINQRSCDFLQQPALFSLYATIPIFRLLLLLSLSLPPLPFNLLCHQSTKEREVFGSFNKSHHLHLHLRSRPISKQSWRETRRRRERFDSVEKNGLTLPQLNPKYLSEMGNGVTSCCGWWGNGRRGWGLLKKRLSGVCPSCSSASGISYYRSDLQPFKPDVFLLKFCCFDRKGLLHEMILVGRRDFNAFGSHSSTSQMNTDCDICGVEIVDGAFPVNQHPSKKSTAFLLGNEGAGLSAKECEIWDLFVYIP